MSSGKNKVINVNRRVARNWGSGMDVVESMVSNPIWISISEPDMPETIVSNSILEQSPHLKISFWDLTEQLQHQGEMLQPPSENHASEIVSFIFNNPDRDILINCAAGISRSGAICRYCEDVLGYKWVEYRKIHAVPNSKLYRMLVDHHCRLLGEGDV
jgi:protein-tyrosine phosphatase